VFGILSGIVVIIAIVFVLRERQLKPAQVVSLSFLIGGGIGNLIDRAVHSGAVADFMNIGIGRVRTGIFNVADLFLMAGGIMFLVSSIMTSRRESK
jgi:signal peptidase II